MIDYSASPARRLAWQARAERRRIEGQVVKAVPDVEPEPERFVITGCYMLTGGAEDLTRHIERLRRRAFEMTGIDGLHEK